MQKLLATVQGRPFRLYLLGHGFILVGAWGMSALGSMLPMAMGASAALMLSTPLLRQLIKRASGPTDNGRRR